MPLIISLSMRTLSFQATQAAERLAALLSLDQILSRRRALAVQHRFRHWMDTVIRRNSIQRDRQQAAQMLARTLERNAMRRRRTSWGQWLHVVDGARQSQTDAGVCVCSRNGLLTCFVWRQKSNDVASILCV